jgi:hypothetical protein
MGRPFVTASAARTAVQTARELNLNMPAPVAEAEAFCAEVERLALTLDPPRPPLPDRPEQLAELVHDHVAAVEATARARHVASTYSDDTARMLITAVQDAVPAWITEMIPRYAKARDAFTAAVPHIPTGLTADEVRGLTPAGFKHWQAADRAAYRLDALIKARRDFEKLIAEPVTGRFADLAAASRVTHIPDGLHCRTTWEQVSAGLKAWRAKAEPVARWQALTTAAAQAALDLTLAEPGALQPRTDHFEQWLDQMLATAGRAFATTTA